MRGVIWLVLLFTVAVVAATTLGSNDGLVSIYWNGYRTDLSLNLFVLLSVVGFIVLALAAQALSGLLSLPARAREWRELRHERAAQAALREALAETYAGRYSRAQRAAQRALDYQEASPLLAKDHEFRVLAHLLAAGSLHRLQDRTRRDQWLKKLKALTRSGQPLKAAGEGAALLAAEWSLDERDAQAALKQLGDLPQGVARRTQALRLRLQAARLARQPLAALHTARHLANHQAFSPHVAQGLLRALAYEALDTARDADQLRRVWQELEQADRKDAQVAARASLRASSFGSYDDARNWLRPFWDRVADMDDDGRAQVAQAFMLATPGMGSDWLPRLQEAQAAHPQDASVAAAVGAALAERKLWGKARLALEQAAKAGALAPRTRRMAWRALAALARQEGDETRAQQCEHEAAQLD